MKTIVVEDDPFWANEIKAALEAYGQEVIEAANGHTAVELARQHPGAGMVLDIVLPDGDGIEVLQKLRESAPDMKVLAISGGGRLGADFCLNLAGAFGARGKLAKPFTREQLQRSWAEALAV